MTGSGFAGAGLRSNSLTSTISFTSTFVAVDQFRSQFGQSLDQLENAFDDIVSSGRGVENILDNTKDILYEIQ